MPINGIPQITQETWDAWLAFGGVSDPVTDELGYAEANVRAENPVLAHAIEAIASEWASGDDQGYRLAIYRVLILLKFQADRDGAAKSISMGGFLSPFGK